MIIELDGPILPAAPAAPAPRKSGDYLDMLLQELCYEVIRREGIHIKLENHEWDSESVALAAQLRPTIIDFISKYNE